MFRTILSNFSLHVSLSSQEKEIAVQALQSKLIPKRSFLVRPGEIQREIYFVVSGSMRMFYPEESGQEYNICLYPENWWACDVVSFFNQKPSLNTIQALEDTQVYYYTFSALEALFITVPKFERFFRILSQNGFEMYQKRIISDHSKTAEERYLDFRKLYPGLEQRISQKHIASFIGITPVFLSMMRKAKNL